MPLSKEAEDYLGTPRPARDDPDPADLDGWRKRIASVNANTTARALAALKDLPVDVGEVELGGVRVYRATPRKPTTDRIIVNFHGGALVYFAGPMGRYFAGVEAARYGATVYAIDFRVPPDHPCPAAVEDCLAAYSALLSQRPAAEIVLYGVSGGGNLAVHTVLGAQKAGLAAPAGVALQSPQLDLSESGASHADNRELDAILQGGTMKSNLLYAAGRDLRSPEVSPLFAEITAFPPTQIQSGTRDMMLSDSVRFHRKLRKLGLWSDLVLLEAAPHGGFGGSTPEDSEMRWELTRFFHTCWRTRPGA